MTKEIQLTRGKVAIVDDEDFETLSVVKWYARQDGRTCYAERNLHLPDGRWTTEKMHRLVLARKIGRDISHGMECDHDDGNGLNNQRENLFEVTKAQNLRNRHRRVANPSSRYLGVCWCKRYEKWLTQIQVNGKCINLGCHPTELEAAMIREAYIATHPELNAKSNFPEDPR
jgi:hypothetical protein